MANKALYDEPWPNYLTLNRKKIIRDLGNNNSNIIENQTFHENAEKVFNKLLLRVREKTIKFFVT